MHSLKNFISLFIFCFSLLSVHAQKEIFHSKTSILDPVFEMEANRMIVQPNGDVYAVGTFYDTIDLDPGPGQQLVHASGSIGQQSFVVKLNQDLQFEWGYALNSTTSFLVAEDISAGAAGQIWISGYFDGFADFDPTASLDTVSVGARSPFILELDTAGAYVRHGVFNNALLNFFNTATQLVQHPNGSLWSAGQFQNSMDFDPLPLSQQNRSTQNASLYLNKMTNTLQFDEVILFDTMDSQIRPIDLQDSLIGLPSPLAIDAGGNIYVGGSFQTSLDADPTGGITSYSVSGSSNEDAFISSLDAAGNYRWSVHLQSSLSVSMFHLQIGPDGDLYAIANYTDSVVIDPGGANELITTGPGGSANEHVLFMRFDPNGNLIWAKALEGMGSSSSCKLSFTSDTTFMLIGSFGFFSIDFDPGPAVDTINPIGDYDGFLLEMHTNGDRLAFYHMPCSNFSDFNNLRDIGTDDQGNIYLYGQFNGIVDFDPTDSTRMDTSSNKGGYFVKLSGCEGLNDGLTGFANDPTGVPISNGEVVFYDFNKRVKSGYDSLSSVNLNGSGAYTIPRLPACELAIQVRPNASIFTDLLPTYYGDSTAWQNAVGFDISNRQDPDTIICKKLTTAVASGSNVIRGQLLSNVNGKTGKAQATPIEDEDIVLNEVPPGAAIAFQQTDANGRFEFSNLGVATYEIVVEVPGIPMNLSTNRFSFQTTNDTIQIEGTIDSTEISFASPTGIEELSDWSLELFPNPSQGSLFIRWAEMAPAKIELYDQSGRKLQSFNPGDGQELKINLNLAEGLYFIRMEDARGQQLLVRKLLIKE